MWFTAKYPEFGLNFTNKYRKRGRVRDRVARNARKKGMEQHANPIKKLVFNKQLSLISSIRKIQKSKKDASYAHANTRCGPIFLTVTVTVVEVRQRK